MGGEQIFFSFISTDFFTFNMHGKRLRKIEREAKKKFGPWNRLVIY